MARPTRSTVMLGAVTALALAAAGWLTTGAALADDAPTPEPTATPSAAEPTPVAEPSSSPTDDPAPVETAEPKPPSGPFQLPQIPGQIAATGAVGGDSFSHAVSINALGLWPLVVLDNTTATTQSGEPRSVIGGHFLARTVWIKWKAPHSGNISFLAYDSLNGYDVGMNIYTGSKLGSLKRIASNDDQYWPVGGTATETQYPSAGSGILGVDIKAGTTYYIQAGSLVGTTAAPGPAIPNLTVSTWGTDYNPSNDDFIHAKELKLGTGGKVKAYGLLAGSTMEFWEPYDNEFDSGQIRTGSIWYKWTAPASGQVIFGACAQYHATPQLAMTVFANHSGKSGVGYGDLGQVNFDYGSDISAACEGLPDDGGATVVAPNVKQGVTYFIQVAETLGGVDHDVNVSIEASFDTPYIEKLSKTSGGKSGGTTVTITGQALNCSSEPTVAFGTKLASFSAWTATSVTVTTPSQTHSGKVSVTFTCLGTSSNPVSFTYK